MTKEKGSGVTENREGQGPAPRGGRHGEADNAGHQHPRLRYGGEEGDVGVEFLRLAHDSVRAHCQLHPRVLGDGIEKGGDAIPPNHCSSSRTPEHRESLDLLKPFCGNGLYQRRNRWLMHERLGAPQKPRTSVLQTLEWSYENIFGRKT